jgi:hypothetical protein
MTKRKIMVKQALTVSERALVQRINRKLKANGEVLKRTRGMQNYLDVGDYWVLDAYTNTIALKDVNIEALGRKLEVLHAYEKLEGGK